MEEKIEIWQVGNTGLRNPNRIQEGFKAFANSPYVGNLRKEKEIDFMLGEVRNKILNHSLQWKGGQYNGLFGSIQKSVAKVYSLYEASQRLYADQKIDESVKELLEEV